MCKSGDQFFGGYTPLSFKSDDSYGNGEDSFIFSLNRKEKEKKENWGQIQYDAIKIMVHALVMI